MLRPTRGRRLDQVLAERWADYSRSRISAWIRDGKVLVDGSVVKPRHAVSIGEQVVLEAELIDHPEQSAAGGDRAGHPGR